MDFDNGTIFFPADFLSEPVPAGQTLSGPQDFVLRRGAVPLLRDDGAGQHRLPSGRLFLQGQVLFSFDVLAWGPGGAVRFLCSGTSLSLPIVDSFVVNLTPKLSPGKRGPGPQKWAEPALLCQ